MLSVLPEVVGTNGCPLDIGPLGSAGGTGGSALSQEISGAAAVVPCLAKEG